MGYVLPSAHASLSDAFHVSAESCLLVHRQCSCCHSNKVLAVLKSESFSVLIPYSGLLDVHPASSEVFLKDVFMAIDRLQLCWEPKSYFFGHSEISQTKVLRKMSYHHIFSEHPTSWSRSNSRVKLLATAFYLNLQTARTVAIGLTSKNPAYQ